MIIDLEEWVKAYQEAAEDDPDMVKYRDAIVLVHSHIAFVKNANKSFGEQDSCEA